MESETRADLGPLKFIQKPLHVVFAEEDALIRLMEMGLQRTPTDPEKTLTYFFGDEYSAPLNMLVTMADRLGLPAEITTVVCQDEAEPERALPSADFVVLETSTLTIKLVEACAPKMRLIQQFGRSYRNIGVPTPCSSKIPVANLTTMSSQSSADQKSRQ